MISWKSAFLILLLFFSILYFVSLDNTLTNIEAKKDCNNKLSHLENYISELEEELVNYETIPLYKRGPIPLDCNFVFVKPDN